MQIQITSTLIASYFINICHDTPPLSITPAICVIGHAPSSIHATPHPHISMLNYNVNRHCANIVYKKYSKFHRRSLKKKNNMIHVKDIKKVFFVLHRLVSSSELVSSFELVSSSVSVSRYRLQCKIHQLSTSHNQTRHQLMVGIMATRLT